jgi:hypothetical protein
MLPGIGPPESIGQSPNAFASEGTRTLSNGRPPADLCRSETTAHEDLKRPINRLMPPDGHAPSPRPGLR